MDRLAGNYILRTRMAPAAQLQIKLLDVLLDFRICLCKTTSVFKHNTLFFMFL